MAHRLSRRGPDDQSSWDSGPVGMGHAMLRTTPESLDETLPLVAGPFALTSDARLDNRDTLLAQLAPDLQALGLEDAVVPDSSLLLAAYARWGEDCVDHLRGAFAFALWDGWKQKLVCVRDHFGIRPLYTVDRSDLIAVASEPKALFALEGVDPVLDDDRIAESLSARLYDPIGTSFRGIVRLPAAHVLTADLDGTRQRRYWTLEPDDPPPPGQAADRFAEIFEDAVRCRVRSAFPVGSELSGGLDSSAVTVVAARLLEGEPLHTVSLAYSDPAADERPFGQAVLDQLGSAAIPHYVEPEKERLVDLYTEIYQSLDDLRARGNGYGNYLTARELSRHGVRVMLTGQDGDSAVWHGWERLAELALEGDWAGVKREADLAFARCREDQDRSRSQYPYTQASQLASAHITPVLRWWAEEKAVGPFARASLGIHRQYGTPLFTQLSHYWRFFALPQASLRARARRAADVSARSLVPPTASTDLVRRTGLYRRLAKHQLRTQTAGRGEFTAQQAQRRALRSEGIEGSLNKLDLYPAASGVEARHPFMDVRLVQFCLGLPSRTKLAGGWSRAVLRDAVGHELPAVVRRRMNKMDHGRQQDNFIFRSDPDRVQALLDAPGAAAAYLDLEAVQSLWDRGRRDSDALDGWEVAWVAAAVTLILWFRASPLSPSRGRLGSSRRGLHRKRFQC
ncbi:asparagine synthase-related protein [Rubrivirga sp.]|uniref:asparagine synthase-related protein n=1 Tax=Rubrivirga sp. TaxID=1885344 RepID=UPI003C722628